MTLLGSGEMIFNFSIFDIHLCISPMISPFLVSFHLFVHTTLNYLT